MHVGPTRRLVYARWRIIALQILPYNPCICTLLALIEKKDLAQRCDKNPGSFFGSSAYI